MFFLKVGRRRRKIKTREGTVDWDTECLEGYKFNEKCQQGTGDKFCIWHAELYKWKNGRAELHRPSRILKNYQNY